MALPLSGIITSTMILTELGFTGSGNRLYNIIQKPGGVLRVKVNSDWVNLNMCSPYLPSEVPSYVVATDWYGYNHRTSGVETLTISGDTSIDVGQTVTYTANLTGNNLTGVVLTWYKFEVGSWSPSLGTGATNTITWTDPRGAKVKVVASNICNFNIVQKEIAITYNCTALSGDPYVGGTYAVNQPFDVWAVNGSGVVGQGTNTVLGITFFWEVTGSVDIISGQGTNKVVLKPTAESTNLNVRVTIGSCGGSITSSWVNFASAAPIVYTYNDAQSASIQKQCPSGQIGSFHTVTRDAGTHVSTNPDPIAAKAEANALAVAWLSGSEAQSIANSAVGGSCGSTPLVPNELRSGTYTRNNCATGTGTSVTLTVPAGTYYREDLATANAEAEAFITANGQSNANTKGTCITGVCPRQITSLDVLYHAQVGYLDSTVGAYVTIPGEYTITATFKGVTATTTGYFTTSGVSSTSGPRLNVTGTSQLKVTVSSDCHSMSFTTGTFTVTGAVACTTAGANFNTATGTHYFYEGVATFGVTIFPYTNIKAAYGHITFLGVNYPFTNKDFSGGFTQYISLNLPDGEGVPSIYINDINLCQPINESAPFPILVFTHTVYYSTEASGIMQKTCPLGQTGTFINYYVAAGQFQSIGSVADANAQRDTYIAQYVALNGDCFLDSF